MGRSRNRILWVLLLTVALAGCAGGPGGGSQVDTTGDSPRLVDLSAVRAVTPAPAWERRFPRDARFSLAPDGSRVAVVVPGGGVYVLGADGTTLWHADGDGEPWALDHGWVLVGPAAGDRAGVMTLFDAQGEPVWSRPATGPVRATAAPDGARVAVADDGANRVFLLDASGGEVGSWAAAAAAQIVFTGRDELLVDDGTAVFFVRPDGTRSDLCTSCSGAARHDAVSPDGQWLAVATGDNDDTLYLFGRDGTNVWHRPLPPGGVFRVAASPDGGTFAVYDAGPGVGVIAVSRTDGRALWIDAFGGSGSVRALSFLPDGRSLGVYQEGRARRVLFLLPSGDVAAQMPLPEGARALLAQEAGVAVTVRDGAGDSVVRFYDLGNAW